MEKKIVNKVIDRGFGFPVILINVPMSKLEGEWVASVNYNSLTRSVLTALADLEGRLTGNQIRFIRQHFEMTLQAFSERFALSHPAVMKWEKAGDNPTSMSWSTEKDIRLFIKKQIKSSANEFLKLYSKLEVKVSDKSVGIKIDLEKLAA